MHLTAWEYLPPLKYLLPLFLRATARAKGSAISSTPSSSASSIVTPDLLGVDFALLVRLVPAFLGVAVLDEEESATDFGVGFSAFFFLGFGCFSLGCGGSSGGADKT